MTTTWIIDGVQSAEVHQKVTIHNKKEKSNLQAKDHPKPNETLVIITVQSSVRICPGWRNNFSY